MAVFLNIGAQFGNNITNSSGIFSGENVQQGWSTSSKNNTPIFITGQCNLATNNVNLVIDPDLIDNPTTKPNVNTTTAPVILEGI